MARKLSAQEKSLLNDFQRDLPMTLTPYADMAQQLNMSEQDVIRTLQQLQSAGELSRVGPVFETGKVGASTLVAMAVPVERLEEVAALVSEYSEVNHNYEREHRLNLWFVVTAVDDKRLSEVLDEITQRSGVAVMSLPMLDNYHIDLGFSLQWS